MIKINLVIDRGFDRRRGIGLRTPVDGTRGEIKRRLFEANGGRCQHPEGCDVTNLSLLKIDHFTPVCVARLLGWTREQLNKLDNLQLLCEPHHLLKDRTSEAKRAQLFSQINEGRAIAFGYHN